MKPPDRVEFKLVDKHSLGLYSIGKNCVDMLNKYTEEINIYIEKYS